ncbi:unnamed protein product [Rotaria sordida]|uniref:Splicing factor cactin central domain-containing protein n=1 Tax=Rotaria sordida TaxID=392033 RepID=A0A819DGD9_9BILA|nr:unnamed protein product [Rotaria sordida]CAF3835121.1 unnamed protein product [Rotaria sordida]
MLINNAPAFDIGEALTFLDGLSIRGLGYLLIDIEIYIESEKKEKSQRRSIIVQHEVAIFKKLSSKLGFAARFDMKREEIYFNVAHDPTKFFTNKSIKQLIRLEEKIRLRIENKQNIVIDFWKEKLSDLCAIIVRARLHQHRHE